MLGYGHDESPPTPDGVFAPHSVAVKGTFTKCSQRVRNLFDIHS
ncbi:hypothetical protein [Prevotella pallens]